jgi:hypothetical protein
MSGATGYQDGSLRIGIEVAPEVITLRWSGRGIAQAPGLALLPFFRNVAATHPGARVEMDLLDLDYCNSACLGSLVAGVRLFNEQRMRVIVRYDRGSRWQTKSCAAMRIFEQKHPTMVQIVASLRQGRNHA